MENLLALQGVVPDVGAGDGVPVYQQLHADVRTDHRLQGYQLCQRDLAQRLDRLEEFRVSVHFQGRLAHHAQYDPLQWGIHRSEYGNGHRGGHPAQ
jgi:hypothetical protein